MPYTALAHAELFSPNVPAAAAGLISPEQWQAVNAACIASRDASACSMGLVTCCFLFACCCHDQAQYNMMVSSGGLGLRLRDVNTQHFGNMPVLQIRRGAVAFQSDYFLGPVSTQHAVAAPGLEQGHGTFPTAEVEAVPISSVSYASDAPQPRSSLQPQYKPVPQQQQQQQHPHPPPPGSPGMRKMDVIVPPGEWSGSLTLSFSPPCLSPPLDLSLTVAFSHTLTLTLTLTQVRRPARFLVSKIQTEPSSRSRFRRDARPA